MTVREIMARAMEADGTSDTMHGVADTILAALSDAGLVVREDWQPIETAPKDDTPLIGWLTPPRGETGQPRAASIYWELNGRQRGYWFHTDGVTTNWQPTHWMPLDPPADGGHGDE